MQNIQLNQIKFLICLYKVYETAYIRRDKIYWKDVNIKQEKMYKRIPLFIESLIESNKFVLITASLLFA